MRLSNSFSKLFIVANKQAHKRPGLTRNTLSRTEIIPCGHRASAVIVPINRHVPAQPAMVQYRPVEQSPAPARQYRATIAQEIEVVGQFAIIQHARNRSHYVASLVREAFLNHAAPSAVTSTSPFCNDKSPFFANPLTARLSVLSNEIFVPMVMVPPASSSAASMNPSSPADNLV